MTQPTTAWGVVVPDLPGCFSAADEGIDQAIENAKEAITLWIEDSISNGESIPKPSSITDLQNTGNYDGWIWAIAEIDPALIDDTTERVNITLPRRILALLDQRAKSAGETRSGYIAQLTLTHPR
ncbi:type II toxin-antitoxin system HicB family antitoxin [Pusillimonas sp. MFBS29]|uniref:type II toxin-antitoxin system HicB family antitoxin n=1 Tax=Pusillimonas sp. MFBS29 TaxID=2886690 RepID=UPI001D127A16|nr:type II toxin-antitoxin system HicB family antitoxin [Pusillimonas sp. MFBS29]MCC2597561.1 type II toxin-antitoxin system HicB family antitoxin [Pusillimonas sp. MFBS29]